MEVAERRGRVAELDVVWREGTSGGQRPAVLFVHGVPTGSWMWTPFLERVGGVAPELPGFGRSAKPGDFDYSIRGYDRFLEAFVAAVGLERFSLVVQDWGGVALALAQRFPERIERLVLLNCVPFLPGYRWHVIARLWRRPLIGELTMGFMVKPAFRRAIQRSNVTPLPDDFVESVWRDFDHGTQRAILRLYRSAPEHVLARAGEHLGALQCPALVLWSTRDPYMGAELGPAYADALGGDVRLELLEDTGHWAWLDRPEVVDEVAAFLGASDAGVG